MRPLLLAVSGGPDSMALLHLAARWQDAASQDCPPLFAATVDHGLRPGSAEEAETVGRWCISAAFRTPCCDGPGPSRHRHAGCCPGGALCPSRDARQGCRGEPPCDRASCRRPGGDGADAPDARQRAEGACWHGQQPHARWRASWRPFLGVSEEPAGEDHRGSRAAQLRRSVQCQSAFRAGAPANGHVGSRRARA